MKWPSSLTITWDEIRNGSWVYFIPFAIEAVVALIAIPLSWTSFGPLASMGAAFRISLDAVLAGSAAALFLLCMYWASSDINRYFRDRR